MTSLSALERMAEQVLTPARSTSPVNLTTLAAEADPGEVLAHPDFVPDAVADAVQIGGMPTHEELAMLVFELRQVIMASFELRLRNLEAMPHNQRRADPCPE